MHQRRRFDEIGERLGISTLSDWKGIGYKELYDQGGDIILVHYNNSLREALPFIYPEYDWEDFLLSKGFQSKTPKENLEILEKLEKKFRIRLEEEWYGVKDSEIEILGPSASKWLHTQLLDTLKSKYPNFEWKPWKFSIKNLLINFWTEKRNQKLFLDDFSKVIGMKDMEGWYEVTTHQIRNAGCSFLKYYNHSLILALMSYLSRL